jgi:hypothetical protein
VCDVEGKEEKEELRNQEVTVCGRKRGAGFAASQSHVRCTASVSASEHSHFYTAFQTTKASTRHSEQLSSITSHRKLSLSSVPMIDHLPRSLYRRQARRSSASQRHHHSRSRKTTCLTEQRPLRLPSSPSFRTLFLTTEVYLPWLMSSI